MDGVLHHGSQRASAVGADMTGGPGSSVSSNLPGTLEDCGCHVDRVFALNPLSFSLTLIFTQTRTQCLTHEHEVVLDCCLTGHLAVGVLGKARVQHSVCTWWGGRQHSTARHSVHGAVRAVRWQQQMAGSSGALSRRAAAGRAATASAAATIAAAAPGCGLVLVMYDAGGVC